MNHIESGFGIPGLNNYPQQLLSINNSNNSKSNNSNSYSLNNEQHLNQHEMSKQNRNSRIFEEESIAAGSYSASAIHINGATMENVQVCVRIRGLNQRESDSAQTICVQKDEQSNGRLTIGHTSTQYNYLNPSDLKGFTYDSVIGPNESQKDVFEAIGKKMALACLSGYNACIFAYGQTGAGKTHTMMGRDDDRGLIQRVVHFLFAKLRNQFVDFVVQSQYFEIYMEEIIDLYQVAGTTTTTVQANHTSISNTTASKPKPQHIRVVEDFNGVRVENLSSIQITSHQQAIDLIQKGMKSRHVAATRMNAESSRSHSIFTMIITVKDKDPDTGIIKERQSKLHFVDLAGSERQKQTQAAGHRLKEAAQINQSLSTLGIVIHSLAEGQRKICYRNSKLTHILKDSLGGNSKTLMIAAVSPSADSYGETLSTLKFAERVKCIKNNALVNEKPIENIDNLKKEIASLKAELAVAQKTHQQMHEEILQHQTAALNHNKRSPMQIERNRQSRLNIQESGIYESPTEVDEIESQSRISSVILQQQQQQQLPLLSEHQELPVGQFSNSELVALQERIVGFQDWLREFFQESGFLDLVSELRSRMGVDITDIMCVESVRDCQSQQLASLFQVPIDYLKDYIRQMVEFYEQTGIILSAANGVENNRQLRARNESLNSQLKELKEQQSKLEQDRFESRASFIEEIRRQQALSQSSLIQSQQQQQQQHSCYQQQQQMMLQQSSSQFSLNQQSQQPSVLSLQYLQLLPQLPLQPFQIQQQLSQQSNVSSVSISNVPSSDQRMQELLITLEDLHIENGRHIHRISELEEEVKKKSDSVENLFEKIFHMETDVTKERKQRARVELELKQTCEDLIRVRDTSEDQIRKLKNEIDSQLMQNLTLQEELEAEQQRMILLRDEHENRMEKRSNLASTLEYKSRLVDDLQKAAAQEHTQITMLYRNFEIENELPEQPPYTNLWKYIQNLLIEFEYLKDMKMHLISELQKHQSIDDPAAAKQLLDISNHSIPSNNTSFSFSNNNNMSQSKSKVAQINNNNSSLFKFPVSSLINTNSNISSRLIQSDNNNSNMQSQISKQRNTASNLTVSKSNFKQSSVSAISSRKMISEIDELDCSLSALNCDVSDPNKVSDKSWLSEYIQEKDRQLLHWKNYYNTNFNAINSTNQIKPATNTVKSSLSSSLQIPFSSSISNFSLLNNKSSMEVEGEAQQQQQQSGILSKMSLNKQNSSKSSKGILSQSSNSNSSMNQQQQQQINLNLSTTASESALLEQQSADQSAAAAEVNREKQKVLVIQQMLSENRSLCNVLLLKIEEIAQLKSHIDEIQCEQERIQHDLEADVDDLKEQQIQNTRQLNQQLSQIISFDMLKQNLEEEILALSEENAYLKQVQADNVQRLDELTREKLDIQDSTFFYRMQSQKFQQRLMSIQTDRSCRNPHLMHNNNNNNSSHINYFTNQNNNQQQVQPLMDFSHLASAAAPPPPPQPSIIISSPNFHQYHEQNQQNQSQPYSGIPLSPGQSQKSQQQQSQNQPKYDTNVKNPMNLNNNYNNNNNNENCYQTVSPAYKKNAQKVSQLREFDAGKEWDATKTPGQPNCASPSPASHPNKQPKQQNQDSEGKSCSIEKASGSGSEFFSANSQFNQSNSSNSKSHHQLSSLQKHRDSSQQLASSASKQSQQHQDQQLPSDVLRPQSQNLSSNASSQSNYQSSMNQSIENQSNEQRQQQQSPLPLAERNRNILQQQQKVSQHTYSEQKRQISFNISEANSLIDQFEQNENNNPEKQQQQQQQYQQKNQVIQSDPFSNLNQAALNTLNQLNTKRKRNSFMRILDLIDENEELETVNSNNSNRPSININSQRSSDQNQNTILESFSVQQSKDDPENDIDIEDDYLVKKRCDETTKQVRF